MSEFPQSSGYPVPVNPMPIPLERMNTVEILDMDKAGEWYEPTYYAEHRQDVDGVVDTIGSYFRPLAEYAQQKDAYFVIAVKSLGQYGNAYTVMPAVTDPADAARLSKKYEEHLNGSWAHIVIDGGQSSYTDTEQIGVKDKFLKPGMLAFDVSMNDGIVCEEIGQHRGTMNTRTVAWKELSGANARECDYDVYGPAVAQLAITATQRFKF